MPYCQGAYQLLGSTEPLPRPVLHSSRKIDFVAGDYVYADDGTGGFAGMSSIAQRVCLLTIKALHPRQQLITPAEHTVAESKVRAALAGMVRAGLIRIKQIDVSHVAAGRVDRVVEFVDLSSRVSNTQSAQT